MRWLLRLSASRESLPADISSIIQELIDQPGWVAGNAIEIIVCEDTSKPAFTAPLLHISYQ